MKSHFKLKSYPRCTPSHPWWSECVPAPLLPSSSAPQPVASLLSVLLGNGRGTHTRPSVSPAASEVWLFMAVKFVKLSREQYANFKILKNSSKFVKFVAKKQKKGLLNSFKIRVKFVQNSRKIRVNSSRAIFFWIFWILNSILNSI